MGVYNYILQMIPVFDSKEINLLLFSPEDLGVGICLSGLNITSLRVSLSMF